MTIVGASLGFSPNWRMKSPVSLGSASTNLSASPCAAPTRAATFCRHAPLPADHVFPRFERIAFHEHSGAFRECWAQRGLAAAPDEAEGRVLSQVNAAAGGSVAMCLGVLAALFAVTWWLNTHFAAGLLWLLHLVEGWSKRDFSGDIDDTHVRDASSRELSSLMNNFKDMLVALRFGTDSWAKGTTRT